MTSDAKFHWKKVGIALLKTTHHPVFFIVLWKNGILIHICVCVPQVTETYSSQHTKVRLQNIIYTTRAESMRGL